ncbi:PAS domain S-box protein [Hyphomonas sp.]|uniref:PAS domain S-box protein n=1 Tax=Hyphomonas sp. TaxID=87 RepID=UPI0025BBFBDC|nr:PAS domain S-box protein [Hyphomonas sp.]
MTRSATDRIENAPTSPPERQGGDSPPAHGAVGIVHLDGDGIVLRCNPEYADMLGRRPDELTGLPFDSLPHEDDAELHEGLYQELRSGRRRSLQINKEFVRRDGSIVWAIMTIGCARNPHGEFDYFVAIVSDTTEKHIASQALTESEQRFRATFQNAAVGMAIVGTDGSWQQVNQKACDITGYTADELMQLTFQDITHPDDLHIDLSLLEETIAGKRDSYSMEKRYFRKDGALVWVKLTVGCARSKSGDVDYFISVIEDITQEKQKDDALHRSEERFRAIFENAAVGMAQVAPDGRWLRANRKVCEILGYSEEELKECDFQSLTHPDDLQKGVDLMKEMFAGQRQSMHIEKRYIHKDGSVVWANLSVSCAHNRDGEIEYMISVIDDITEKKQMRQDLDASNTRFQAIQKTIPDGFMVFRSVRNSSGEIEDFVCEYGNPASARMLMIDPADMPGYRMLRRNPGNRDIGLFDAYCNVVETGGTIQGELEFPLTNGTFMWFRYSAVRVDDGFAVSFTDISDSKRAELELRRSEERFRAAQQTTPDGFLMFRTVFDEQGDVADFVCEYANPAAERIVGRPVEVMVGQTLLKNTSIKPGHPLFEASIRMAETDEPFEMEVPLPVPEKRGWLRIAAVRIETGFAVTFSDITERKKSELRLRESEARLRAFHQTTPDGFIIFKSVRGADEEITDFRIVYANPAAQRMSRLDADRLRETTLLREAPLLPDLGVFDRFVDVAQNGEPWQGEIFYPTGSGRGIWNSVTAAQVDDGFAMYYSDISKEKRAEKKLREQEERARAILNNLISFVTLMTPDGVVVDVNESALALAKLKASDVVGKHFWETYWWSHDSDAREELRRCVLRAAQGERVRHDTTVRTSGDERIAVANLLAPVVDESGAVINVVASGFDISDRKKAEQHREMLVNELSHRVKNSLATVQTIASHTLREASDLESFRETFVGRLMAISKCHDLLIDTTRSNADISQLVRDQVLPYAPGGLDRQVSMSGPPLVLGPEAAHTFGLILHELATNASKYGALSTERGHLEVTWKRGGDPEQNQAIFTWVETGGPPVTLPTRRGFGSVLIEQSLAHTLDGKVQIEYRPEGFWAQFRFRKKGPK